MGIIGIKMHKLEHLSKES